MGLRNNVTDQKVVLGGNGSLYFTDEDCKGTALISAGYSRDVICRESPLECFAPKDNLDGGSGTVYRSLYKTIPLAGAGEVFEWSDWGCKNDNGVLQNARLGVPFFPADEILNASYPSSYRQL